MSERYLDIQGFSWRQLRLKGGFLGGNPNDRHNLQMSAGGLKLASIAARRTSLRAAGSAFWVGLGQGGWQAPGMSMDNELQKDYALLLGIGSPWEVKSRSENCEECSGR